MRKLIASLISTVLILTLTSCGYNGGYRYSCQDPTNWEAKECNPPICEPSGTCSRDLVGKTIWDEYQKSKVKMAKERLTPQDLDARLKFILGITLGTILLCTSLGILYGLLFVTQPVGAQSENDKMFFNVLGSVATFITGTLAGLLIGQSGAKDIMKAQLDNKEMDAKNTQADKKVESEIRMSEEKLDAELDEVRARLAKKPDGAMPVEQPVDTEWDKD